MSISDIQNELDSLKTNSNNENSNNDINDFNEKTMLENKIKTFENFMDSKVTNMYARPWSKLEIKLKKKKIIEYFGILINNKTINAEEYKETIDKFCKDLDLNRKFKVKYDIEECCITEIKY